MSTTMDNVAGKGRDIKVNTWVALLIGSLVVLGANVGYASYKAGQLSGASSGASELQVLSQQLAVRGTEAVGGNAEAFKSFRDTKARIDQNVQSLQSTWGDDSRAGGAVQQVAQTWAPIDKNAEQVLQSEQAIVELAGHADRFNKTLPNFQATLDELVRAMSASGSPSSQVYIALRQVVLSGTMARRIAEIRSGGAGAQAAGDALGRDANLFTTVLAGLGKGDDANRILPLTAGPAVAQLRQVEQQWAAMRKDLDAITASSRNLVGAQRAADEITGQSGQMLADSQKLFGAFTSIGSIKDTSLLGNIWISIVAGALTLFSILGLLYALKKQQDRRYQTTKELNDRNQEAIMRLLDEMGSLAEGDLTVKATVTEDMTGAIA
ncbi:MAG TPA: methyl-accepting chemotaxis protein, partial [Lysobacter sp.]|nr:methyl-accepting chemotaxis protein [Lysobacter sp.]